MRRIAPILFALLLIPSIALSLAARKFAVFPLDIAIAEALEDIASPYFSALMTGVSVLGQLNVAEALIVIAAAAFALGRQWLKAAVVLATSSSLFISFWIKAAVARPRPTPEGIGGGRLLRSLDSFPSGHAVFYAVFFGMLGYLAWVHLKGYLRWTSVGLCAALILLVGPSRVFLEAHWPSDVLGGYLIGGVLLVALAGMYDRARGRLEGKKW